jgi:hypothetical protein
MNKGRKISDIRKLQYFNFYFIFNKIAGNAL